jgi:hypothetical protein
MPKNRKNPKIRTNKYTNTQHRSQKQNTKTGTTPKNKKRN